MALDTAASATAFLSSADADPGTGKRWTLWSTRRSAIDALVLGERDPARLERWIARAIVCSPAAALLAEPRARPGIIS